MTQEPGSPLPDARGEERSEGRVRTIVLLVSTSLALGLMLSLRNLLLLRTRCKADAAKSQPAIF